MECPVGFLQIIRVCSICLAEGTEHETEEMD